MSRILKLSIAVAVPVCLLVGSTGANAVSVDRNYQPLPNQVARAVSSVSAKTLNVVGQGKNGRRVDSAPGLANQPRLESHGEPEVAYVMADFCPFCAAENWGMAVALSRFGTFRGLTTLTSNANDMPASIQSISFRYAHFHSKYLAYDPIVNEGANHQRIDKVPHKVAVAWHHYGPEGFPFMDFSGKAVLVVSSFNPSILALLSRAQIAADLNHPHRKVAEAIDGAANQLTAAICLVTHERPGRICHSNLMTKIRRSLKPAKPY